MVGKNIIWLNQMQIIKLFLKNNPELTLFNNAYNPKCNSNPISLGQLQKTRISYLKSMILKKDRNVIRLATSRKNLFVFYILIVPNKTMLRGKRWTFLLF